MPQKIKLHFHLVFVCCLILLLFNQECESLRSLKIRVPEFVKSGDAVTLSCDYDLEQAVLYSIKWYWNQEEIYRFVPKESPPFQTFLVPFINIDVSKSGPTTVTLLHVRREISGKYACEVTADLPLFHTDIKEAFLTVINIPSDPPRLAFQPAKVVIGEKLTATCTSAASDPAANITWFVNNKQVDLQTLGVRIYPTRTEKIISSGLYSAYSTLEIEVEKNHFDERKRMNMGCKANIYSFWNESVEAFVYWKTPNETILNESSSWQSFTGDNESLPNSSTGFTAQQYMKFIGILLLKHFLHK